MSCFAERGFCVLGDLCQFDHGNDPLVVDEVSLPSMIPFPPPPPGLPPPPGMLLPPLPGPARNMRLPVPQAHPQAPPPVVLPVPSKPKHCSVFLCHQVKMMAFSGRSMCIQSNEFKFLR